MKAYHRLVWWVAIVKYVRSVLVSSVFIFTSSADRLSYLCVRMYIIPEESRTDHVVCLRVVKMGNYHTFVSIKIYIHDRFKNK